MKKPIIGILGAHMSNNGGPAPVPADYVIMLTVQVWKMQEASPFFCLF